MRGRVQRLCRSVLVALAATASQPATAETLGGITAFLDGEERHWHTVTMERRDRTLASASLERGPRLTELFVHGHREPRFGLQGQVSIEVRYLGDFRPDATPLSVDIIFAPRGMGGPFWTTRGAPDRSTIDVIALDIWGNSGRLEAAFSGLLCLRETISTATDSGNCKRINGMIDTRLHVR